MELFIAKQPTNMVFFPIEPHLKLAITWYRCAHGFIFSTVADLYGVSISLPEKAFASHRICKDAWHKWRMETESHWLYWNYDLTCAAAWNDFHVYVGTKLKNFNSFKKKLLYHYGSHGLQQIVPSWYSKCPWLYSQCTFT